MNKTTKTLALSTVLLLTLSMAIGGIGLVSARPEDTASQQGRGGQGGRLIEQIGEEAAQILRDAVQAMRDAGASFEEIRDYIHSYLADLGVELPEPQGQGLRQGKGMRTKGFMGRRGQMKRNQDCPLETPEPTTTPTGSA